MFPPAYPSFFVLPYVPYVHQGYAVSAWLSQTRTQGRVKLCKKPAELVEIRDCQVRQDRSDRVSRY